MVGATFALIILLSPIAFSANALLMLFGLAGLTIVVGGVVATAFMSFPAADVRQALQAIPAMLRQADTSQHGLI